MTAQEPTMPKPDTTTQQKSVVDDWHGGLADTARAAIGRHDLDKLEERLVELGGHMGAESLRVVAEWLMTPEAADLIADGSDSTRDIQQRLSQHLAAEAEGGA